MPNTLAHLGVHALLTRSVIRQADEKWIYIGAVLPDVGWILHRVTQGGGPQLDAYDARLYATAQTSLFVTLLLAGGLSLLTRRRRLTFGILSLNALIHLLLDACEIKWGNGVILFAPLSWTLQNWGQFWPEQWPTLLLTLLGVGYFFATLRRTLRTPLDLCWPGTASALLAASLIAAYFALPWVLRDGPLEADVHYVRILRDPQLRNGAYVEFDREEFHPGDTVDTLEFFGPTPVTIVGIELSESASVSVRGRFTDANTIQVLEYHVHRGPNRDLPTILGLAMILAVLTTAAVKDLHRLRERV